MLLTAKFDTLWDTGALNKTWHGDDVKVQLLYGSHYFSSYCTYWWILPKKFAMNVITTKTIVTQWTWSTAPGGVTHNGSISVTLISKALYNLPLIQTHTQTHAHTCTYASCWPDHQEKLVQYITQGHLGGSIANSVISGWLALPPEPCFLTEHF